MPTDDEDLPPSPTAARDDGQPTELDSETATFTEARSRRRFLRAAVIGTAATAAAAGVVGVMASKTQSPQIFAVLGQNDPLISGQCPPGQNLCDGVCVDFSSDVNNCGGCGIVCSSY